LDLEAVRECTRVMPKPCADLLGLHWSALTRLPLARVAARSDGEITDDALLASLRPCAECRQLSAMRASDRDALDRFGVGSQAGFAIVEGTWYQAWLKYVMDELQIEPPPARKIENRSLFQHLTPRPRTNLVQARDYVPVSRELWNYIATHYDADCMVSTKYSSIYSSGLTIESIETNK
jgi:hypothetical protein